LHFRSSTLAFTRLFASWLSCTSPFRVTVLSEDGLPVGWNPHLARAGKHLRLDAGRLGLDDSAPASCQRPSGLGTDALGVLLTGIGDDGESGSLDIRSSGGYTVAEEKSTAVVNGMPGAAVRINEVCESLPLPRLRREFWS